MRNAISLFSGAGAIISIIIWCYINNRPHLRVRALRRQKGVVSTTGRHRNIYR